LVNWLSEQGEQGFRAQQIMFGLYQVLAEGFYEISTLPRDLQERLSLQFDTQGITPIRTLQSEDGQTIKTLFKLSDGYLIEAVLMIYDQRRTVCISTQSGCGLRCSFCATGQMGLARNLSSGEIIAQVIHFARQLNGTGERITNIVFMGMGEPFHNYDNMMKALNLLNEPRAFGFGARRMTISTAGIVPKIRKFADTNTQINLAVSLHTVDDALRSKLMPINQKYPINDLLDACRYYIEKTNRRITFEYALIEGLNDSKADAVSLANRIKGMLCHVNLIPLNPTRKYNQKGSNENTVRAFANVLESHQIACSIRLRRGIEIGAGCGQLAAETE